MEGACRRFSLQNSLQNSLQFSEILGFKSPFQLSSTKRPKWCIDVFIGLSKIEKLKNCRGFCRGFCRKKYLDTYPMTTKIPIFLCSGGSLFCLCRICMLHHIIGILGGLWISMERACRHQHRALLVLPPIHITCSFVRYFYRYLHSVNVCTIHSWLRFRSTCHSRRIVPHGLVQLVLLRII